MISALLRCGVDPQDTLWVITRFDATGEGVVFLAWFPLEPDQASTMEAVDQEPEGRA